MKQVILKSISLVNFKGEKERTTEFNPDVTTIKGMNGLGKSRHFDAFIWLLFGKDSQDRKDYEIKTRIDGEELHNVESTVSAVILVDGQELTLKRSLVEEWVKPRGKAERVFKGNRTDCWWNDVPVSVGEYAKRVSDIIDDSLFKMLTNPTFFVNMKMQAQRDTLFAIAGTVTDAEIAAKKPEFAALLDRISGKSLSDFKAEIAAKKRLLKGKLAEISPRIDQTQKMKPASEDFAAIEAEIARIDAELKEVDEAVADINKAIRLAYEEERGKVARINTLKSESQKALFTAQSAENDKAYKANEKRRELTSELRGRKNELDIINRAIHSEEDARKNAENTIIGIESQMTALRAEWSDKNGREYKGNDICPVCHQELPEVQKADARARFAEEKERQLAEITKKGKSLGESLASWKKELDSINAKLEIDIKTRETIEVAIKSLEETLSGITETVAITLTAADVPECVELANQIAAIEATISHENTASPDNSALVQKKSDLSAEKTNLLKRLAVRDTIRKADEEIVRLGKEEKELANQIAAIEGEEITVQDFIRAKIEVCEANINKHFNFVQFKLYDTTIEGNIFEVCIPLINGIPYGTANSASKVNAGLDIINALCRFNGVCAPIFIDNRESVNELIHTDAQIINLVVTRDKELVIE